MKTIKYLLLAFLTPVLLTGCFKNDNASKFTDKEAFVAFEVKTKGAMEHGGQAKIYTVLSSASNINASVNVEIDHEASTAIAGVHYVDPGVITINFPGGPADDFEAARQYFTLDVIDNDTEDGPVTVSFRLVANNSVALGAVNTCLLTIIDDESPLAILEGNYTASGRDQWKGAVSWPLSVVQDTQDESKYMIYTVVPLNGINAVEGRVSEDKTSLIIPLGQVLDFHDETNSDIILSSTNAMGEIIFDLDGRGNVTCRSNYGAELADVDGWFTILHDPVWRKDE